MPRIVMKFGGTSMAGIERIRSVAARVRREVEAGNQVLVVVSAMAGVTRHLGFGITANLSYDAPYLFARRMSTLDHLSDGRVGWNIVTGYLESAARAMGLTRQVEHDRRYDQADEYLEVLYKLWEGSWEEGAVLNDRQRRIYARPDKVHKVVHHGEFFDVEGYHLCEPSPQRTPVLFQAGSSARGLRFAGEHAECVFISGNNKAATRAQVDKVRAAAQAAGRDPHAVKVFMGISVIVAPTEAEARAAADAPQGQRLGPDDHEPVLGAERRDDFGASHGGKLNVVAGPDVPA